MKANHFNFIRSTGLLAGAMLALSGAKLLAGDATNDPFPSFDSYIKVSGQGASITGDGAAYQARARQHQNGAYGIEDLHMSKDASKDTTVTFDGHALSGAEDYLGVVRLTKNEVGSIEIGYKRFRTFYDGVGGFFDAPVSAYYPGATYTVNKKSYTPTASKMTWSPLTNPFLNLDRGKFWVDATVALPNLPVFSVKYTNELRNGRKDSTIWGDTDFTGLPNTGYLLNPISPTRKIMPSWINVSERHENLEASVRHTVGKVTAQVGVFYDTTSNIDTRYVIRYPGEVKIFTVPASNLTGKLLSSMNINNQIQQYQTDGMATETRGVDGKLDVAITDQISLKLAGAYEKVSNDVTGDRPLITATETNSTVIPTSIADTGVQQVYTNNTANLMAKVQLQELTGSAALDFTVNPDLFFKVGVRGLKEYFHSDGGFTAITAAQSTTTGVITTTSTPRIIWARLNQSGTTPVVEARYTGIKNVALYFTGSQRDVSGDERNIATYTPSTNVTSNALNQSVSEKHGDYTLGANWRVSNMISLRGEVFQKEHKDGVPSGTLRSGANLTNVYYLLDLKYTGFKATAVVKPLNQLSFTTRYVYQKGKGQVTGTQPTVPTFDSLTGDNHQFGETIDWSPNKSCYVQLSANVVYNYISTIYPRAGSTTATATAAAYDVNRVLQNSLNNYMTFTGLVGCAVDARTDVQLEAIQTKASNGNNYAGLYTTPYGVAYSDYTVSVGIKHRFSDRLVLSAKVGYADSKNDTTGGLTNYKGPLAYVSFDHAL